MAASLWTRSAEEVAKDQIEEYLLRNYGPRPDSEFHGGLVKAGSSVGKLLGGLAGKRVGGYAGGALGAEAGALGGAWAAHGAYREGQLIKNILTYPENWTVDAAGAIVLVMPAPNPPSDTEDSANDADGGYLRRLPKVTGGPSPATPPSTPPQGPLSLNDAHLEYLRRLNAHRSEAPYGMQPAPPEPPGGPGMLLEYLRSNPIP